MHIQSPQASDSLLRLHIQCPLVHNEGYLQLLTFMGADSRLSLGSFSLIVLASEQRDFQGVPDDGSVLTKHGQVHLLRWHSLRASPLLADAIQVTRATADPCSGL